jgi:MFS family permease
MFHLSSLCAAVLPCGCQGEFNLSNFQDGLLPAAFMVSLSIYLVHTVMCRYATNLYGSAPTSPLSIDMGFDKGLRLSASWRSLIWSGWRPLRPQLRLHHPPAAGVASAQVGLLVASVVFAEACKRHSAFRLLGIGMGIWAAACALCGVSANYGMLITARMIVGVGEASFVAMAAPFIGTWASELRGWSFSALHTWGIDHDTWFLLLVPWSLLSFVVQTCFQL